MLHKNIRGMIRAVNRAMSVVGVSVIFAGCTVRETDITKMMGDEPRWSHGMYESKVGPIVWAAQRPTARLVHIYIEGDGAAFTPDGRPSLNPTPHKPVALRLALADKSGARVVYLGRPCQWQQGHPQCQNPARWTDERFEEDVVEAYTRVLADIAHDKPTELIGFSGGAWIALQVGARVPSVQRVRTVAGNLLPNAVNRYHQVKQIDVAPYPEAVSHVPQWHVWGGRDNVIPTTMAEVYKQTVSPTCAQWAEAPKATHTKGWEEIWPQLLQAPLPECAAKSE